MRRFVLSVVVVVNLLLVDAVTKELAAGYLKGAAAISIVDGFFDFVYVENRGCAWGLLQGQVWPLALVGVVALALLVWRRRTFFGVSRLGIVAEPLLYAGILGNLIDRLFRGYVIDFIDLHYHEAYHFPCFNVADVCITLAAGLLLLSSFGRTSK